MVLPSGNRIFRWMEEVANFKTGVANELQNIGAG